MTDGMRVRKNILILTSAVEDNIGIEMLTERLERDYKDFQPIVLNEADYGGLRRAHFNFGFLKTAASTFPRVVRKTGAMEKLYYRKNGGSFTVDKLQREIRCVYNAIIRFVPEVVLASSAKTLYYALAAKRKGALSCKVISLMPGFTVNKHFADRRADAYIVENGDIKAEMVKSGISDAKISVLGLPFDEKKYIIKEIIASKESLGLNFNATVLVSGGFMSAMHVLDVCKLLLDQGDYINILAVCGRNDQLFNKLIRIKESEKADNLRVYGADAQLSELLTASDMVVTSYDCCLIYKSLLRGLPLIVYAPLSSYEEAEFIYLEKQKLAFYAQTYNDTVIGMYQIIQQNLGAGNKDAVKAHLIPNALTGICSYLTVSDGPPAAK